jgi:hypothetical protein
MLGSRIASPGSVAFARSVADWQRRQRMPRPDGVLDAATWRRIAMLLARAGGTTTTPPSPHEPSPDIEPDASADSGSGGSTMTVDPPSDTPEAIDAAPTENAADTTSDEPPNEEELASLAWEGGRVRGGPNVALTWSSISPSTPEVDVVIHLHGYAASHRQRLQLKRDIVARSGREWSDAPGGMPMAGRSRPTLGILPMGRFFGGESGRGYHFPGLRTREGLQRLVTLALNHLASRTGISTPRVARLILTAHSGGGAPLVRLLKHCDPNEIHIFDGLYGDPSALIDWARRRVQRDAASLASAGGSPAFMPTTGGALRVLYTGRGLTCINSNNVSDALASIIPTGSPLAPWYRVEHTTVGHMPMPRVFGWRLLQNAAADLPDTSPASGCRKPMPSPQGELDEFLGLSSPLLSGAKVLGQLHTPWWARWVPTSGGTAATTPPTTQADPRLAAAVRIARAEYDRWGRGTKHESKDADIRPALVSYWKSVVDSSTAQNAVNTRKAWSAAFISWVLKQAGYFRTEFRFAASHSTYIAAGKAAAAANDSTRFRTYRLNDPAHGKPQVGDLVCRDRSDGGKGCGGTTYDNIVGGSSKTHCDLVVEVAADHIMVIGGNVSGPRCPRDGCTVNIKKVKLDASGFVLERQSPGACKYFAVMKPPATRGAIIAPSRSDPPSQSPARSKTTSGSTTAIPCRAVKYPSDNPQYFGFGVSGSARFQPTLSEWRDIVLASTAAAEGGHDTVNMWDKGILSWGIMQWTLHAGSLQRMLAWAKSHLASSQGGAAHWSRLFPSLDIETSGPGPRVIVNGTPIGITVSNAPLKRAFWGTANNRADQAVACPWLRMFAAAGRDPLMQRIQTLYARLEVDRVLSIRKAAFGNRRIGDFVGRVPRAVALVFGMWTQNPKNTYIHLARVIAEMKRQHGSDDPARWPQGWESAFARTLERVLRASTFAYWGDAKSARARRTSRTQKILSTFDRLSRSTTGGPTP